MCAPLVSVLSTGRHTARADRLFTTARGIPQLTETLVSSTAPAAPALRPLTRLVRTCPAITQLATNGDLAMKVSRRTFPKVGDHTVAVRLTMTMDGARYTADLVYVAVGRNALRFNLVTTTPLPDAEVERIVRAGVARLGI
ncbi:MAG: hypothetical protein QG622_1933 [Actinomycetota bacterium]|nr:hypothetical protein [Actinomycetota bacterium]